MQHNFTPEMASIPLLRYPRTMHLEGSRLQSDDHKTCQSLTALAGAQVVIEEKLDGANSAISFTEGGELLLQSRGHYLQGGGRERQFAPLHRWARAHEARLLERLEDRYVMYGEWCYAKHSIFYDALPHWFHEFDVWDRQTGCFLSTPRRHALLQGLPVLSVPVLYQGDMPQHTKLLTALVRPSLGKSAHWKQVFEQTVERQRLPLALCWKQTDKDDCSEGLYVKVEDAQQVLGRYKWVRPNFVQTIVDSDSHHASRPIIANALRAEVDLYAPELACDWSDCGLTTLHSLDALKTGSRS